jgi:hypothetical protein
MSQPTRTPWKTEACWLLGTLGCAFSLAVGGAAYFLWRVMVAGAGC